MARKTNIPSLDAVTQRAEDYVRREPAKAVAAAFGAGILLSVLPLRPIAAGLIKVAFSFAPSVLALLALQKACDSCHDENQTPDPHE